MHLNGINDLPSFLRYLRSISAAPWFHLRDKNNDQVTVEIAMVGIRLEVDFFQQRVAYRSFAGDESVLDDEGGLLAAIGISVGQDVERRSIAQGGLGGLLALLNLASAHKVDQHLAWQRDEAVMVTLAPAVRRVEVEFFEDHIEYSVFEGDESVHDDQVRLFQLIDERGR